MFAGLSVKSLHSGRMVFRLVARLVDYLKHYVLFHLTQYYITEHYGFNPTHGRSLANLVTARS